LRLQPGRSGSLGPVARDVETTPAETTCSPGGTRPGRRTTRPPSPRKPRVGIGALTAVTILAELGDCTRFSSSRQAVRYAGLDITAYQSDRRRAPGHLSRQGPPALRWALFEASMCAARQCSPDHEYYSQAAERLGSNRARLSVARKILKRSYHLLRELGDEAIAPI
jgi:transposase